MLSELFKAICDQSVRATGVEVKKLEGTDIVLIKTPEGVEKYELPPSRRRHAVFSLADLIQAAEKWGEHGVLFHNDEAVVLVIDDAERRDVVELKLVHSIQYKALLALLQKPCMSQRESVRLLKYTLNDCVPEGLYRIFAKLEFRRSNTGHADIAHGKESLGRNVEAAVQGTSEIPEQIRATIPIYSTAGVTYRRDVLLSVDVDPQDETFTIAPFPDALEKAVQEAQAAINADLQSNLPGLSVFFGKP
jgi:hypothetical protein